MRLLFVVPEYPPNNGGIATLYGNLAPALVRRGHKVDVIVGSAFVGGGPELEADGVRVRFLDEDRRARMLQRFARYGELPVLARHLASAWALWEQVDGGKEYDAVEVTDWGLLFVPWVIRPDSAPNVVQLHGSVGQISVHDPFAGHEVLSALARLIEKTTLGAAARLQTISRSNQQFWEGVTGRSVECIPPFVPCDPDASTGSRQRTERGMAAGRVQRWKGVDVLCQALRLAGNKSGAVDWYGGISADGETGRPFALTLQADYPDIWGTALCHRGPRPRSEIAELQQSARFVVVPSRWDVFNLTCAEAMAAGTPVVCAEGAGASEWIEPGRNGWKVPSGDAHALAEALKEVSALPDSTLEQVAREGQSTVRAYLSEPAVVPPREASYQSLAAHDRANVTADEWLREVCSPGGGSGPGMAFLDQQPVRGLVGYLARRVFRRGKR